MDFLTSMQTSLSGLNAQRIRVNTISSNLANVNTLETAEGGPYRRKEPVFSAIPSQDNFNDVLSEKFDGVEVGEKVRVARIEEDMRPPKMVYNPNHPLANADGYVAMPNIDPMMEMVNLLEAQKSYEANVNSFDVAKDMAMRALEIGK